MKIKAQNTLAWGSKKVEIDFSAKGLTLIKGRNESSHSKSSNGCGKSTILNTLLYARYGIFPDGIKKADMVNSVSKKNSVVEYWETKNGKECYITRGIKCNEMTFNKVTVVGDFLLFFLDGKDMRGSTAKVTQEAIEQFLQVDAETFTTAALFSSASDSFAGKSSGKQEEVFSKILHLEDLEVARLKVRDRKKEVEQEILNTQNEITRLTSHIEREEARLDKVSESKDKWEAEKVSRLSRLEIKIENLVDEIKDLNKQNENNLEELEESREVLDELEDDISEFNEDGLKENRDKFKTNLREIDTKIGGVKFKIRELTTEIKQAQSMNGVATCPKCFNEVDKEHLYSVIEEKNETKDNQEESLVKLQNGRSKELGYLQKAETELSSVNSKRNEIVSQKALISRLEGRVDSVARNIKTEDANLQDNLRRKENLEKEKAPQGQDSKDIKDEIDRLEDEIEESEDSKDTFMSELDDIEFCLKMFGPTGIRNLLVRSVLPELNNSLVRFADILTNGELNISFTGETEVGSGKRTSTRNKMQVAVTDRFGSDKYACLSAGERRRVDLCVSLALNQLLASRVGLSFLICDEIFLSTDGAGKEKIMELLNHLLDEIPSLFIISNQDEIISDSFENIWTVVRQGRESYIEFN